MASPLPSVLCVGELLVDFIATEEGPLRDAGTFARHLGGSPANLAVWVAKVGGTAVLAAAVGDDPFGDFLRAELERHGVGTSGVHVAQGVPTTMVVVSRTAATPEFAVVRGADTRLDTVSHHLVEHAAIVHTSAFALSREPQRSTVLEVFTRAGSAGKLVSVDPNYSPKVWPDRAEAVEVMSQALALASLVKPSLDDGRRLFGDDAAAEVMVRRFHEMGPPVVVLTMGRDGFLVSDGSTMSHVPPHNQSARDATGAGDAFWAGFLVATIEGHRLGDRALFARAVVERKLRAIGHELGGYDRAELYREAGVTLA